MRVRIAVAILLFELATPLAAQWANYPIPGIPRKADGTPDLAAPAPRTADGKPDLSGMWSLGMSTGYVLNILVDQKPDQIQPWAAAFYKQQMEDVGKNDPATIGCLPLGPRRMTGGGLAKIIQSPYLIVILSEDLTYRQIFLDGRPLPKDPQPSFVGYSVGHWEGDTLVVESSGFNERTWLDMGGHPHTEALRTIERYHRTAFGHMDLTVTLDDPRAYNAPWTVKVNVNMEPDTEFIEYVCTETPRDTHVVGRTPEEQKANVSREILAKYVGAYEAPSRRDPAVLEPLFKITMSGDDLLISINGKGNIPFIPLSETTFSPRLFGTFVFFTDDRGMVTHLVAHGADGDITATRKKE
jgi:hypothetical protein